MSLSEQNRALIERETDIFYYSTMTADGPLAFLELPAPAFDRLLDAARAEGVETAYKDGWRDCEAEFTQTAARIVGAEGVAALQQPAEPVAAAPHPRFAIGQPVEIPETFQYFADWRGVTLWIAGVQFDHRKRRLDYIVSEHWPPRHNGDLSDGWAENDLTGAFAPAVHGGEHG